MRAMKKLVRCIAVTSLIVSLSACGIQSSEITQEISATETADKSQSQDTTVQVSAKGELPIASEPIELDVVVKSNPQISDYENNLLINYMEEKTGIKANYIVIPADDITQKINLMLSSGQDMPDIFISCLTSDLISTYSEKDMFVPINDYLETQSAYFEPLLEEREHARESLTLPDGRIVGIPYFLPVGEKVEQAEHSAIGGKMWINQTWLDNLGLEMPTTTDEFKEVLQAFKEKDPNGNGKMDEIPLIGATKGGWDSLPEIFLSNAFLPYDNDNMYYIDDNGKVQASYAQDEYREALIYLNSLSEAGLLDSSTYTQDNAQLKQLVEKEEGIVGCFPSTASSMAVTPGTDRFKEYVALPPLKGPEGVQLTKTRIWSIGTGSYSAITSACENPEAAFKWLDYWYSEDISIRNKYGVEGVHWQKPAEGTIGLNGEAAKIEILIDLYSGDPNNVRAGHNLGCPDKFMNYVARSEDEYEPERVFAEASQLYFPYAPAEKNYMKSYFYNVEDAKRMSEVNATLVTYIDEARTKFILGIRDIHNDDDWNDYMKEIEKIGYQTILDIMQNRVDIARK